MAAILAPSLVYRGEPDGRRQLDRSERRLDKPRPLLRTQQACRPQFAARLYGDREGAGGPHQFDARHARRKIQAMLDRETRAARERGQSRKLFLDYLIERVQGRSLTDIELDRQKAEIAKRLLEHLRAKEH